MTRKQHFNNHHTQFYKALHESMPDLKSLRQDKRLIVPMALEEHDDLHRNVAMVPPLPVHIAGRAFKLFNEFGDAEHPVANLENYMRSVERASNHHKARPLEQSIAEQAVLACYLQLPYIKDGYVDLRKYT